MPQLILCTEREDGDVDTLLAIQTNHPALSATAADKVMSAAVAFFEATTPEYTYRIIVREELPDVLAVEEEENASL